MFSWHGGGGGGGGGGGKYFLCNTWQKMREQRRFHIPHCVPEWHLVRWAMHGFAMPMHGLCQLDHISVWNQPFTFQDIQMNFGCLGLLSAMQRSRPFQSARQNSLMFTTLSLAITCLEGSA